MKVVSVVLSGGAGTRLWPASRQSHPKPFMRIGGDTLLGQAVARGQACGINELVLVTNSDHLFLSRAVIEGLKDAPRCHYLVEPQGRNTAPAIALATLHVAAQHGPETVLMVLPADHLIPDTRAFVACALDAFEMAGKGRLVVFGVQPTHPDTGFGYIEVSQISRDIQPVLRFVEKPDLNTALSYLTAGRYFWNSGMFCFKAQAMLDELAKHAPHVLETARNAARGSVEEGDSSRFDEHIFKLQPDISIDYAVMEHADNVSVVPARFGWSDVGTWPAVANAHVPDTSGNTFQADVVAVDTRNTHVQVESHSPKVVATVGLEDLVIVDTPDALLVAHKSSAQNVKSVVEALKARGHESAKHPAEVRRPWGSYVALKEEPGYKVKRICVRPGQSISLQLHNHRAEHWVVVQGTALVQVGERQFRTEAGEYRYIPVRETHRISNDGTDDLVVIEVQCGAYLGEDDIVRLADNYGRV